MNTRSVFEDVAKFHKEILKQPPAETPMLVDLAFGIERFRFMQEELDEFIAAVHNGDIVEAADGLADIIYVAAGTMYLMGLPAQEIWNAVQSANMKKVAGQTKRGNKFDAMKPEGWIPPNIAIAKAILGAIK